MVNRLRRPVGRSSVGGSSRRGRARRHSGSRQPHARAFRARSLALLRELGELHYLLRQSGYPVSAPEWPRKEGDVAKLREDADAIEGLGLTEIVDHYEREIRALDEPPVLIGHSFGGLIVELLLDRGLGRAGVAMSPAPPKGILVLPFSSLKAASPALAHPSRWHGVVPLTLEEFTYGFVNTFSPDEAKAAYEKYAVPETGQIFYEAGFANFHLHPPTEVHFKNDDRAPLLIVGATKDDTVPASVARKQTRNTRSQPLRLTTSSSSARTW